MPFYRCFFVPFCLLLWASLPLSAQTELDHAAIVQQFPDADAVFLHQKEHVLVDYVDDAWNITRKYDESMYFITEKAPYYANQSIYYSSFEKVENLDARTLVPLPGKKGKYKEYEVTNVDDKDVLMGGVFYSDMKQKSFVFPGVQLGATTVMRYDEVTNEPRLLNGFYFGSYVPVLKSEFKVTLPKSVTITYDLWGENTSVVKYGKEEKDGWVTHTWSAENLEDIERDENTPARAYYEPHIIVYINKIDLPGGETREVLTDAKSLYDWYLSLVKQIPDEGKVVLQPIVDGIVAECGKGNERAIIKGVYQWVQANIKYIAFEDGLGGFVPRSSAAVCEKKYGDCKDMSNIIVDMLHLAGIRAYHTWIGTRDKPYPYQSLPTPLADNHMIAAVQLDGEFVFLDATGEFQPFGMPTSMIQGKEALIGIDDQHFEIVKVPVIGMDSSAIDETVQLTINGRDLVGNAHRKATGYKKVFAQYNRIKAEEVDKQDFFRVWLRKGSNKFAIENQSEKGFYNPDEDIEVDYGFVVPGYITKAGGKLYVNMNLVQRFKTMSIDLDERKTDRENEFNYVENYTFTLQIPDGYELDYLPEDAAFSDKQFGFDTKYAQSGNEITMSLGLYMNHLMLKKDRFDVWNEMVAKLSDAYQDVVVLKLKDSE